MELTEEQKQAVAGWVNEGVGLPEVQNKIREDFGIAMTFMDVRFLVDDLDLELQDENAVAEPEPQAPEAPELVDDGPVPFSEGAAAPMGSVSVDVDAIQRPGAVMSGNVTFSDGKSAGWQVDQMGRLGLIPSEEGYQPSEEDVAEFQTALQAEFQKKGF